MKKIYFLFILDSFSLQSQTPNWIWAKSAGGNANDISYSISADATGNTSITGYFQSPSIVFGSYTLTNGGGSDMFISKTDPSGNSSWAQSAGTTWLNTGKGVVTDANGNTYVTGTFQSPTITFGSYTFTVTSMTGGDVFLVKYDSSGNVIWAKAAGGTGDDLGWGICTDANGNAIITGYFNSATITFGSTTLTSSGSRDLFIVKYDASGNVLWAKSAGGNSQDQGLSVCADAGGNIFVTGYFQSNSITFGSTTLTNAGGANNDFFIAKYDASGNVLWAKSAGGSSADGGFGVYADAGGNVFATGTFDSPLITFGSTTLTNSGTNGDFFIVKYSPSSNVLWAKSAGGTNDDGGEGIITDTGGNAYVTGGFRSPTLTFGSNTLTNTDNTGNTYDVFVVKYDPAGNVLWVKSAGGNKWDVAWGISIDGSGNVYITGDFFSVSSSFGSNTLTNTDNSGATDDIFVAKLGATTGIKEENIPGNVFVYPNPSSGIFHFKTNIQKGIMKIYNTLGQEIFSILNLNPQILNKVDLSGQASGIYFYQITSEEKQIATGKLIIQ